MKRVRLLLSLLLSLTILLGVMPWAYAVECTKSPSGYHDWKFFADTPTHLGPCNYQYYIWEFCNYCGVKRNKRLIQASSHNWSSWVVEKEASCTVEGIWKRTCYKCGLVETEPYLAEHSYGPWSIVSDATDHSAGTRKHTCSVCSYEEQESFDPEGTLRRGDKGSGVYTLQKLLIGKGYLPAGSSDGDYGEGTESAIRIFQQDAGLTVDGVAWPQTIKLLDPNVKITVASESCLFSMRSGEEGRLELLLDCCKEHAALHAATETLNAQNRKKMWKSSVESAYNALLNNAESDEVRAVIQTEREAFQAWLSAYEAYCSALYHEEAEQCDAMAADQLMRHAAMLCWLNHPNEPAMNMMAVIGESQTSDSAYCSTGKNMEDDCLVIRLKPCEDHRLVAAAAAVLPADQARLLWLTSLEELYENQNGSEAAADQEAFLAWLDAYEALIRQLRSEEPDVAASFISEAMMEYVFDRCSLLVH